MEPIALMLALVLAVMLVRGVWHLANFGDKPPELCEAKVVKKKHTPARTSMHGGIVVQTFHHPARYCVTFELTGARYGDFECSASYFEEVNLGEVRPVQFQVSRLDEHSIHIVTAK